MADTFTLQIIDIDTVSGTDVLVPITTGSYSLRVSPFTSATYNGVYLDKGVWDFGEVNDGVYELWDESGTPSKMVLYGRFWIGDKTPTLSSLIMNGNIDMVGNNITYANSVQCDSVNEKTNGNGINLDGAVIKDGGGKRFNGSDESNNDVMFKGVSQTVTGAKTFSGVAGFTGGITITTNPVTSSQNISMGGVAKITDMIDPTNPMDGANRRWTLAQIASISVTPFQESPNIIRLIPGGTEETNKVYTSWAIAQNVARGYASSSRPMTIEVKGTGTSSDTIVATNGALSGNNTFNPHVSVTGVSQRNIIDISQDESVTVSGCVLTNLYLKHDDSGGGSTPNYNGFVFVNCYIDIVSTSNFTFTNCTFRNCFVKCTVGAVTYTNCKGFIPGTNTTLPSTISGFGNLSTSDF